jgi:protein-S-isoprenylcysteine O-methyltransferase Ste14
MNDGPKIKGNPLKISVYLLVICYFLGEFIFPKYPLFYAINLIGIVGLLASLAFFFLGFNIFKSYKEDPKPSSSSNQLIKTGIFAYTRNPIYLSFILFHFSMFLVFENVMYFLTALCLSYWIHNYVIKFEEDYLLKTFSDEYKSYMSSVSRWLIL